MRLARAWRSRWWNWVLPLAFCLLNATFLGFHLATTGERYTQLERQLEEKTTALASLEQIQQDAEALLDRAHETGKVVESLYARGFSTEAERLTELITEVKGLARRCGLDPPRISYPEEVIEEYGLIQMSMVFGVEGTYSQLRSLVNMLELSDLFLVLEQVRLRGTEGARLGIDLTITTLFADNPSLAEAPSRGRSRS